MGTKYSSQAISGYNASPPPDDGTQSAANEIKWSTIKSKLPDPIKTYVDAIQTALLTHIDESVEDKAVNYTTTAADHKRTINATAAITISLGDASTMDTGYIVTLKNSHTASITVDRATGTDTIDGSASDLTLNPNKSITVLINSSTNGYLILTTEDHDILSANGDMQFNIDADNGSTTAKFSFKKDTYSTGGTELMSLDETGDLTVLNDASIGNDLTVTNALTVSNGASITGDVSVTGGVQDTDNYEGSVYATSGSGTVNGKSGFTYVWTGTSCAVTHNFGTSGYSCHVTVGDASNVGYCNITRGTNAVTIKTYNATTDVLAARGFAFSLHKWA